MTLSLKFLAAQIQAAYLDPPGASGVEIPVAPFCIDTRLLKPGEIFIAIQAERDGHDYVQQAIEKGASAVMVSRKREVCVPQILVQDTVLGMGALAHEIRKAYTLPVIGLTGSCGKTSTKEMIALILAEMGETLYTEGTLNNHLGVPMTLSRLTPQHRFAVIEMGTNHVGEIPYLAQIVEPTVALITNIRASHLEGFGSFEALADEKSKIYAHLAPTGIALINQDEVYAPLFSQTLDRQHQVTFGVHHPADVRGSDQHFEATGVSFLLTTPLGSTRIQVPLLGDHVIYNAVAAAAAALSVGADHAVIQRGLAKLKPMSGRFHPHTLPQGGVLIDDAFNASASSVENAILSLDRFEGDRLFVMSSMGELGAFSVSYHENMGDWIAHSHIRKAFLTGDLSLLQHTINHACGKAVYFETHALLLKALEPELSSQSVVLVKGSHAHHMQEIVKALLGVGRK